MLPAFKTERATILASITRQGRCGLDQAAWTDAALDGFRGFPHGSHDDIVDAVSQAVIDLEDWGRLGTYTGKSIII